MVTNEMQKAKTSTGKFLFSTDEWLTTGQVRSYFARTKAATKVSQNSEQTTTNSDDSNDEEDDAQVTVLLHFVSIFNAFFHYRNRTKMMRQCKK
jgi:hypothetical protein